MNKRIALIATGISMLALGLTACGGGEPGFSAGTPVKATFSSAPELAKAGSDGASQARTSKFSMEGVMDGSTMSLHGQGRYEGANSQVAMTVTVDGETNEARFLGRDTYLKLSPDQASLMDLGKPWLKLGENANDPAAKAFGAMFAETAKLVDPATSLETVAGAGTVTKSEPATVDGKQATKYLVNLDPVKLAQGNAAYKDIAEAVKGAGATVPMEVWLDGNQRPVRFVIDVAAAAQSGGAAADKAGKITVNYTDWGTPVDVQAPPSSEVQELDLGGR